MILKNMHALPVMLIFIGLVVCAMNADKWMGMQKWTPEEIQRSVELNHVLDLARQAEQSGGNFPRQSDEEREQHLAAIHYQMVSKIEEERTKIRNELLIGALLAIGGLVLFVLARNANKGVSPFAPGGPGGPGTPPKN